MEELMEGLRESILGDVFGIWFLIGAALVFFMQAGFAMVETGFTRAKNAGNIIMKNLMDFCIGTVVFTILGFGLLCGENALFGLIGKPNWQMFSDFGAFISENASSFVFNLVFCATTATIVSGAMAERTRFLAYCIYSAVISLVIYPIEAHWIWGGGWLSSLGFHDYAGSTAIHMVGGIAALVGAIILGPRIGKYVKDKNNKVVKVNAIPGHSIPLGALGCFILWFGWYGFNGAAAKSGSELASIFMTTTIAPAVATVTTMIFTWIKNGKPDVSMCLNASLAGLVGITAGCAALDALGATIVGIVSGFLVVFVVEFLDLKLHIDDPVGAVAVHMANGIWGTIAVGLLANPDAPAGLNGLLYTGSFKQLGVQLLGVVTVAAYTIVTMTVTFLLIKKLGSKTVNGVKHNGLRADPEDEIAGLDSSEHGLPTAYAGFMMLASDELGVGTSPIAIPAAVPAVPIDEAVPVQLKTASADSAVASDVKITKIEIFARTESLGVLKDALAGIGITGMTVSNVLGCGVQKGKPEYYRGVVHEASLLPKIKVEVVVSKVPVSEVVRVVKKTLYTGHIGDGKIFIYDVENVIKVRTGEEGYDALQDAEEN